MRSRSEKAIIFIGGGEQLLPELERVKQFLKGENIRIIITDKNPASPCRKMADEFYEIDGLDILKITNLVNYLKTKYDILFLYTITETYPSILSVEEVLFEKNSFRAAYISYNKSLLKP